MQILGRAAIVTGAAQGIGRAVCEAILKKQGKVCLADIDEAFGIATAKELQQKYGEDTAIFFKCDVSKKKDQEDMFNFVKTKFGKIDIVCNNAGINTESYETYDSVIGVNMLGVITGCMLAVEHMKKTGGGVIINMNSSRGLVARSSMPVYNATKWGIVGYSKSLALQSELKESDIRINLLCPGSVRTRMVNVSEGNKEMEESMKINGILEPSRVADGFIQLVEDDTKHGAILTLTENGGFKYVD